MILKSRPLTAHTFKSFETLFGKKGACGGCWCMWWRQSAKEFEANKGEANRRAMRKLVSSGHVPGIIAYHDGEPVSAYRSAGFVEVARRSPTRPIMRKQLR